MRMWMIDPKLLCMKHLVGEHGEIHKHIPSFRKRYSVDGRFANVVQIELHSIQKRHDELAEEINRRTGGHKSPLVNIPDLQMSYPQHYHKSVDTEYSKQDLCNRCDECRKNILEDKK